MKNELIHTKILRCDVPIGPTKRIYPRSEVIRAMDEYMSKKNRFGIIGFDDIFCSSILEFTHHVENLSLDDEGYVIATIKFLLVPKGQEAKLAYEDGLLHFRTASYGDVGEGGILENLKFWMICLVDNPTDM